MPTEVNKKTDSPKITVIVPVRNEAKKISRCLEALLSQSLRPHEIIVVDGHSTDKTVEMAQKYPVKVFFEDIGTRAGANNIGIENAEGDFISFTDADCIPDRNWLRNLIKEFDSGIVGVGGAVKNIGDSPWEASINLAVNSFLGSAQSVQGRVFESRRKVTSISGCNSMYRKEALAQVGGFDNSLPTAEDTELNRRLRKIGDLIYTPDAFIVHNHTRGLKDFAKRTYQYGYGKGKCLIRDLQLIPPLAVPFILILPFFSIWAFFLMILLYSAILFAYSARICRRSGSFRYFGRIVVVFVVEHVTYTVGMWKGLFAFALNSVQSSRKRVKSVQTE
jgi:glycosyltransferase involved in cell wall biosynthesis